MTKKISLTQQYLRWVLNKYHALQKFKQSQEAYRIVGIEQDKAGNHYFQVQVSGKSSFFTSTPQEIVLNDQLLEGFSKKDIRTITYYATLKVKQPKYKIVLQEYCGKLNKMLFKLMGKDSKTSIEKTAAQITLDKDLITQLDPNDAHLIGFITANEQISQEKEQMEKLKQSVKQED